MTESKTYYRIRLLKVPLDLEDDLIALAFKFSSSGISEALQYIQRDLAYDPDVLPTRFKDLDAYFTQKPETTFFDEVRELNSNIQCQIFEEENKDWLEEWKKGFVPFRLVGPFWVVPSWLESPAEAERTLHIDPGMAFGTGTHATTQMAASLVYKITQQKQSQDLWDMVDVGTGTAILAVLARQSGVDHVVGLEIDPEARRVARENVIRNKISEIDILDTPLEEVKSQFQLVVANIIDGVLVKLKNDLLRVLRPGGHIVLTGILEERESLFLEQFIENSGLQMERRLLKDEWVGYWLSKPEK